MTLALQIQLLNNSQNHKQMMIRKELHKTLTYNIIKISPNNSNNLKNNNNKIKLISTFKTI